MLQPRTREPTPLWEEMDGTRTERHHHRVGHPRLGAIEPDRRCDR